MDPIDKIFDKIQIENRRKATLEQFDVLLTEIEKNPKLLNGRMTTAADRAKYSEHWNLVAEKLNSIGPGANKSAHKWQQAWRDWKSNTRKKAAKILEERAKSDGKPPSQQLTDLELRVINLFGLESSSEKSTIKEIDISQITEIDPLSSEESHEEPDTFTYAPDMVTVYSMEPGTSDLNPDKDTPRKRKSHDDHKKSKTKRHRVEFLSTSADKIRRETNSLVRRLAVLEGTRQDWEYKTWTLLQTATSALERCAGAAERHTAAAQAQTHAIDALTQLISERFPPPTGDKIEPGI